MGRFKNLIQIVPVSSNEIEKISCGLCKSKKSILTLTCSHNCCVNCFNKNKYCVECDKKNVKCNYCCCC